MLCNSTFRLARVTNEFLEQASSPLNIKTRLSTFSNTVILVFIEFVTPIQFDWFEILLTNQVEPLQYYPDNTYLCCGLGKSFSNLLDKPFIQNLFWFEPEMKRQVDFVPELTRAIWLIVSGKEQDFGLISTDFNKLPGVKVDPDQDFDALSYFLRFRATINSQGQKLLLEDSRVIAIEAYETQSLKDEVAGLILAGQYDNYGRPYGSYLKWLSDSGVDGSGVTVGVVDSGVNVAHPAFDGRIKDLTNGKSQDLSYSIIMQYYQPRILLLFFSLLLYHHSKYPLIS